MKLWDRSDIFPAAMGEILGLTLRRVGGTGRSFSGETRLAWGPKAISETSVSETEAEAEHLGLGVDFE